MPMSSDNAVTLAFTKMHGLGNDFVMISSQELQKVDPDQSIQLEKVAAFVCDRHFGIGADGLITDQVPTVERSPAGEPYDLRFVYLNGDGSWAEMCGNGIRCFARFVRDNGRVDKDRFNAETLAGPIQPEINADGTVTVDMGAPILQAKDVPFAAPGVPENSIVANQPLSVLNRSVPIHAVSMGNPHCLIFRDEVGEALDPAVFGPAIEAHPSFPKKTNVEFLEVIDEHTIRCVVWERGCGFTLACGTGACASAVAGIRAGKVKSPVTVHLPGGPLSIAWAGEGHSVYMTGPATYAFTGTISIPKSLFSA